MCGYSTAINFSFVIRLSMVKKKAVATIWGWCLPPISISRAFPVRAACSENLNQKSMLTLLFKPSPNQNVGGAVGA